MEKGRQKNYLQVMNGLFTQKELPFFFFKALEKILKKSSQLQNEHRKQHPVQ